MIETSFLFFLAMSCSIGDLFAIRGILSCNSNSSPVSVGSVSDSSTKSSEFSESWSSMFVLWFAIVLHHIAQQSPTPAEVSKIETKKGVQVFWILWIPANEKWRASGLISLLASQSLGIAVITSILVSIMHSANALITAYSKGSWNRDCLNSGSLSRELATSIWLNNTPPKVAQLIAYVVFILLCARCYEVSTSIVPGWVIWW